MSCVFCNLPFDQQDVKFLHFGPTRDEMLRTMTENAVRVRWPQAQHEDLQVVYTSRIHIGDKGRFFSHYQCPAVKIKVEEEEKEKENDQPEWPIVDGVNQ